jgi:hypothetical protein
MHKVAIGFTVLALMAFTGSNAEALPSAPPMPNYSPVETIGCGGPGRCPTGRFWACGPAGCWCRPCGGVYRGGPYWRPWRPWRWRY